MNTNHINLNTNININMNMNVLILILKEALRSVGSVDWMGA